MPKGRPTACTPEVTKLAAKYAGLGMPVNRICDAMAIKEQTWYAWLKKHSYFGEAVKKARAEFMAGRLDRIKLAEREDWHAAAWLLERLFPREFAKVTKLTLANHSSEDESKQTAHTTANATKAREAFRAIFGLGITSAGGEPGGIVSASRMAAANGNGNGKHNGN